jgi:hypothetical protein
MLGFKKENCYDCCAVIGNTYAGAAIIELTASGRLRSQRCIFVFRLAPPPVRMPSRSPLPMLHRASAIALHTRDYMPAARDRLRHLCRLAASW